MTDAAHAFYYTYGSYRTRERAEEELEDSFAQGDVSESDRPRIVERDGRFLLQLLGWG